MKKLIWLMFFLGIGAFGGAFLIDPVTDMSAGTSRAEVWELMRFWKRTTWMDYVHAERFRMIGYTLISSGVVVAITERFGRK